MDKSADDLFLEVEGESGKLRFYWEADNKLARVVADDGDDHALQSSPSPNMMMHTSCPPEVEDLLSSSMPTTDLPCSLEENQDGVRINTDMSYASDHDAKSIEELCNRMIINPAGPSNATPPTNNNQGLIRMETEREQRPQDSIEIIQAEPRVRPEDSKKRELWTIDEQKSFLMGVMVFGYKWKQIRTHFVRTKSCSQFGSHVQKFKKRMEQMNRKKHTINDIRIEDITHEDVVRLAPKEWQPTLLSAIASCSNGEKTYEQQIPIAPSHENSTGRSSTAQLRLLVPSVPETVMNPSAPIAQPDFSVGLASSSIGPTPVQPRSFFVLFADGCCTPLMQPSRHPRLGEAYLGYPSSTSNPASYQPLSVPQLGTIPAPGSYYPTPMRLPNSYTGLAPTPALHPSASIRQGWDCPNPWKNS